jgi:ectoine hydroxylase-related dioxygenase (phytanoyl-CoA dioxygenase family)
MVVEDHFADGAVRFGSVDINYHVDHLNEHGYTVIDDVLTGDSLEEVQQVVRRTIDAGPRQSTNEFKGLKTIRIGDLLLQDALYRDLVLAPPLCEISRRILGDQFLLSSLMTMAIEPGAMEQPLHCDDIWACRDFPRPFPTVVLTAVWAITEFTEENGATHVIPGTHRSPFLPVRDISEAVKQSAVPRPDAKRLTMNPGSVAIWAGAVWHHAGANRTVNDTRIGLTASYNAGWLRPYENYCFTIPVDVAETFPAELQEMTGFGTFFGGMGTVRGEDPRKVLFSDQWGS